jgi:formylglycine-generating enzyme required for sulfatase activity
MGNNPSKYKGTKNPVELVNWWDCLEFIYRLNLLTGKQFHLPTEAEWEYAARGGNVSCGYKYAGSNNLDDVAWYGENSGRKTHPVKDKIPNELGIYDMIGNVGEWCQDAYGNYSSDAQTNPNGPVSGSERVYRGSSWFYNARVCRVSRRFKREPTRGLNLFGLRLAL